MEKKTRRKFAPEYKREAVELACHPGQTIAGVARDLGIRENLLRFCDWIKLFTPFSPFIFLFWSA